MIIDGLYLIEILHQTTTATTSREIFSVLYLIEILHQTTTNLSPLSKSEGCILSKFYIKPQHCDVLYQWHRVVSYRNSTSNHNGPAAFFGSHLVVSYRNSTSNHNQAREVIESLRLYLIEILHQTTTLAALPLVPALLYLIEILHQTTTHRPRKLSLTKLYLIEILHQTTTLVRPVIQEVSLYSIEILHQTTTPVTVIQLRPSCILSKFYIKPQHLTVCRVSHRVVSYRNSTSNHNGM